MRASGGKCKSICSYCEPKFALIASPKDFDCEPLHLNDIQSISYLFDKKIKKLHGPTRIKQEIRQKGFPPALIEQEIEQSDVDWYELVKEARVRKFGEALPTDSKEKNKQIRHLQYKGFAMDMIFEALS